MVYKCKICGGQATIDSGNGVVVCEYCGTKQALPLFTADSERLLYDRGNNYLLHSEYDKAENVFNQLLAIKPGAAELYWDLVLCKYGVTYVKDPKTGKYIPTCNRTHYTPIFSDENYKKAIELSTGEKKALFEEDAKTIDNIQKGIIAVSKKEKPFDIFISYKETDANGNRTKDSIEAQKLYEKLTEAGYKVFFSRITLEDKIGTEYEPYIYAALYSSKVMLTLCSSKENIEAVWVKNEWSRFLGFRQNDNSKTLLPLYFGMDKTDLPEEFALLSAHNIHIDGFEDDLLRGIKKLIPLPIMQAKQRKRNIRAISIAVAVSLVVVAAIVIPKKLAEWKYGDAYQTAMQLYYDGKYAEATWAFDALGNYKDSAEQKEKAELSWRKSLANVVSDDYYNSYVNSYFITQNGAVADIGTGEEKIKLGEHGKVVSISNGWGEILALYEDGVAMRPDSPSDKILEDVVQIVPTHWIVGDIALKADGTVYVEGLSEEEHSDAYMQVAECFDSVSKWKNIVMLSACVNSGGNASFDMTLAGLDADGNLHILSTGLVWAKELDRPEEFVNVNNFAIGEESGNGVNIAALTNDGNLVTCINGKTSVVEAKDVVDVYISRDTVYLLSEDGKMRKVGSNAVILSDVIEIGESVITRSGTIDGYGWKTAVHNEWLARMD